MKRICSSIAYLELQAHTAGDEIRPRMSAADTQQNPRAIHKPSPSAVLSQLSAGLTSEGKRQAQVAGDRIRCRKSPICQSNTSRLEALGQVVNKTCLPSFNEPRGVYFDELQDAQDQATATFNTAGIGKGLKRGQPSLLEVFEAELAKKTLATNTEKGREVEPFAVKIPVPESANPSSESQDHPLPEGPQALIGLINERLHGITGGKTAFSQDFSAAIEHGVRTAGAAVSGLSACIQTIVRVLQEASTDSRQVVDRNGRVDLQRVDDALHFQGLTGGPTAISRKETTANRAKSTSASRSRSEENGGSSITSWSTSHDRRLEKGMVAAHNGDQTAVESSNDSSRLASSPGPIHAPALDYLLEKSAGPQLKLESKPTSEPSMCKRPPFHEPVQVPFSSHSGHRNYPRRSQSTRSLETPHSIQRPNSSALHIHFPPSPQFLRESFGAASFPALPSMKALVPQKAPRQYRLGSKVSEPRLTIDSFSSGSGPRIGKTSCGFDKSIAGYPVHSAQSVRKEIPFSPFGSAARLAGPFDPLEAEPSARLRSTEGLQQNATTANTDNRHTTRHAKTFSEVYDGSGRLPWSTFLQDDGHERIGTGGLLDASHETTERQSRPRVDLPRHSPLATAVYDDQHHDDSNVGKISDCVERLRDLGFGGNVYDSGRLLIYAQAAEGVLADAIDLIDEEQRAWQRL